jgi:hypothetical protein
MVERAERQGEPVFYDQPVAKRANIGIENPDTLDDGSPSACGNPRG